MTDDEIRVFIGHINATYGKAPLPNERTAQSHAWKRFIHDLDADKVTEAFNAMALYAQYQPRPGEIRVRVLLGDLPSGLEAWTALQKAREAIQSGSDKYEPMHTVVAEFVRSLGDTAMGLHTNGDRSMFLAAYERHLAKIIETTCRVRPL